MIGKVLVLWQGWHRMPADSGPANNNETQGWFLTQGSPPGTPPTGPLFDMWPDLTGYPITYDTGYNLGSGANALLYSDLDASSVARQCELMKSAGIDCLSVQRFGTAISNQGAPSFTIRNTATANAMAAAELHGRTFTIMWDTTSMLNNGTYGQFLIDDWKYLVDTLLVTGSPQYQRHTGQNGQNRPVVEIWGPQFEAGSHPGTPTELNTLINWFHGLDAAGAALTGADAAVKYRATVIVGVNLQWPTSTYNTTLLKADVLQPWTVGRYSASSASDLSGINSWITTNVNGAAGANPNAGLTYIRAQTPNGSNQPEYMPVFFPGSSDYNREGTNTRYNGIAFNHRRRWGGHFLWNQAYAFFTAMASTSPPFPRMCYIATLDEFNEGTAILPCSNSTTTDATGITTRIIDINDVQTGTGPSQWNHVNQDNTFPGGSTALPTNWYMRVVGEIAKITRGHVPPANTLSMFP